MRFIDDDELEDLRGEFPPALPPCRCRKGSPDSCNHPRCRNTYEPDDEDVEVRDGETYWMGTLVKKCSMCGVAPTNVDDCGCFGDPTCPYFGILRAGR